jgi:hypothetical protein
MNGDFEKRPQRQEDVPSTEDLFGFYKNTLEEYKRIISGDELLWFKNILKEPEFEERVRQIYKVSLIDQEGAVRLLDKLRQELIEKYS